MKTTFVIFDLN